MTVFTNYEFFFRFFPIFLVLYYILPRKWQNPLLFVGSIVFYSFGQLRFMPLLLGLTIFNYVLACTQQKRMDNKIFKRRFLTLAVTVDVFALFIFKVLALSIDGSWLPLGISFFIFKMISFQADVYMGKICKKANFFSVAAYFTMFPQLTQGPIMRYDDDVFNHPRKFSLVNLELGLQYFILGMAMKVLLADRIAILWNEIAKIGYESISTSLAWLGAYGYSFELYFDFWGYSLMAAGLGVMLGFPFVENFHHPYASKNIATFYRDWHMTLGSWFRDYIYIPLGGSRVSGIKIFRNLMIVWAITGLWHGGTVNFLIWGLVLGLIIALERFAIGGLLKEVPAIGRFEVLVIIPLTWVIFAITNLGDLGIYFARLFPFFGIGEAANPGDFMKFFGIYWGYFAASVLLLIPGVFALFTKKIKGPLGSIQKLVTLALFLVSLYYVSNGSSNPFLYFSF
ncbi:MAG: MBOAT family protein [Lachnospiraceae bacterium]|nr:MBOAT family protein [Lachnospiraceae bacterium]